MPPHKETLPRGRSLFASIENKLRGSCKPLAGLLLLLCLAGGPSHASWLEHVSKQIGLPAKPADGTDQLTNAIDVIARLTVKPPALVLAATVSDEGHWTFANQTGQRYTVADKQEMARLYRGLAPNIEGRPAPVVIYVTAASVFDRPEHMNLLPKDARIRLVTSSKSYPLSAFGRGSTRIWFAKITNNVFVRVHDAALFEQAAWQLQRPLRTHTMRIVALAPGAPDTFRPAQPRGDKALNLPGIDAINPDQFASALKTLRRQTLVMTGRLQVNNKLVYRTSTGAERSLSLAPLHQAAAAADANLIIFNAQAPRQPGARNWLWQRIEVDGLAEAMQRDTLGDFLNAMAGTTSQLFVEARIHDNQRAQLRIIPMRSGELAREPGSFSSVIAELVSEVVGNVLPHSVELDLVAKARQLELDRRLIPGLPAWSQYGFVAAILLGLLGLRVAMRWWERIWPPETRQDYAGKAGFMAASIARWLTFFVLFLPLAGLPAVLQGLLQAVGIRRRGLRKTPGT